jgi:hypothetical protein
MTATLLIHNQFRLNLPERQLSSSLFFFFAIGQWGRRANTELVGQVCACGFAFTDPQRGWKSSFHVGLQGNHRNSCP